MLPRYNGLRTRENGPAIITSGAPTSPVTRVRLPAYATPQNRIDSPTAAKKNPDTIVSNVGLAKMTIASRNGIGV